MSSLNFFYAQFQSTNTSNGQQYEFWYYLKIGEREDLKEALSILLYDL